MVLANCNYSFVVGEGSKVDYDFSNLERQLIDRFLFSKSIVNDIKEIATFTYRSESTNASMFDELSLRIKQTRINNSVHSQICGELQVRSYTELCESLDKLDIAIKFLKSVGTDPKSCLSDFMTKTLKMDNPFPSQKAQQFIKLENTLYWWITLSLERCKLQHSYDQDAFEGISDTFKSLLNYRQRTLIKETMNRLSVEHMNATLIVVFECIMMKLDSPESDAFVDISFHDMLYGYIDASPYEEDTLVDDILREAIQTLQSDRSDMRRINTGHAVAVWKLINEILITKQLQRIDVQQIVSTSSKIGGHDQNVDWFKCIFCQTDSLDTLQCPASARQNDTSAGYKTLSENLEQFNEINSLPSWLDLNKLNDGSGIQNTLIKSNAKWHKKCRLKFNTTELKRAQKRQHRSISDDGQASLLQEARKSTRLSLPCKIGLKDYVCFFCDSIEEDEMLREAATYGIDNRVRECAQKLQDTALLAKLSAGDLVAQEAKYHAKCLIYLYRKASRVANDDESEGVTQSRISHGIALAELVSFIEESRSEDNVAPVFKMSDLSKMYGNRLEKMGAEQEGRVHSTRLKNRLLTYVPDIEAYKQGRENLLAFKDDIGPALRRACEEDFDSNYMQIYKAVKIVRSDMMATSSEFNGTFAADCQEKSVPRSLLTLVNMLLYGPDITTDSFSQETLSIAQMLIFNSHKRIQKSNRHAKSRETPSQMYLGIVIHCQTRKRGLIDKMYKLGLSVSYDRIFISISISYKYTM
ncbi:Hypothetical predicted protein [Mytilus galloprovincialis]|uniref:Uncharacterized protein n=1 Tax=Mytilus galloprovincialis TaxID=29158 RepID=A0A8B6DM82_MYTGA|nr:Hypothetical predicted protein [Mytilus galloprovincialis]